MTAVIMDALAEYLGAIEVPGHAGLLEGAAGIYVVHVGDVDDRTIIRLVERWAAVRRRYANRRVNVVLVAERIEPRFRDILAVISQAVPIRTIEMALSSGCARFTVVSP